MTGFIAIARRDRKLAFASTHFGEPFESVAGEHGAREAIGEGGGARCDDQRAGTLPRPATGWLAAPGRALER